MKAENGGSSGNRPLNGDVGSVMRSLCSALTGKICRIGQAALARELGVSRQTLYTALNGAGRYGDAD